MSADDQSNTSNESWFNKKGVVITLLVFCFPVGLYGMWKSNKFQDKTKWMVTGIMGFLVIISTIAHDPYDAGLNSFNHGSYSDAVRYMSEIPKDHKNYSNAQKIIEQSKEKIAENKMSNQFETLKLTASRTCKEKTEKSSKWGAESDFLSKTHVTKYDENSLMVVGRDVQIKNAFGAQRYVVYSELTAA
jgi:hypothetical protein